MAYFYCEGVGSSPLPIPSPSFFFLFPFFFLFIFSLLPEVFTSEALAQVHPPADVPAELLEQRWLGLVLCPWPEGTSYVLSCVPSCVVSVKCSCDCKTHVQGNNGEMYIVQFQWVP